MPRDMLIGSRVSGSSVEATHREGNTPLMDAPTALRRLAPLLTYEDIARRTGPRQIKVRTLHRYQAVSRRRRRDGVPRRTDMPAPVGAAPHDPAKPVFAEEQIRDWFTWKGWPWPQE